MSMVMYSENAETDYRTRFVPASSGNLQCLESKPAKARSRQSEATSMYEGLEPPKEREPSKIAVPASHSKPRRAPIAKRRTSTPCAGARNLDKLTSAAFYAAEYGDTKALHEALSQGVPVNSRDAYDWTLFMVAASAGHLETVRYCLRHQDDVDVAACDRQGHNAEYLARRAGHNHVAELIAHPPPRARAVAEHDHKIQAEKTAPWLCDVCGTMQTQAPRAHQASISHNVCCNHPAPPAPFMLTVANRGYQMMLRDGWEERGLGAGEEGRLQPVKTALKRDRLGLGNEDAVEPRITHFRPFDVRAVRPSSPPSPKLSHKEMHAYVDRERARDHHIRKMLKDD